MELLERAAASHLGGDLVVVEGGLGHRQVGVAVDGATAPDGQPPHRLPIFGEARISTWALIHPPDNQPPIPLSSIERTYLVAPELASADDHRQIGHRVRRRRVWGLVEIGARVALRASEHRAAEPLWMCVCIM